MGSIYVQKDAAPVLRSCLTTVLLVKVVTMRLLFLEPRRGATKTAQMDSTLSKTRMTVSVVWFLVAKPAIQDQTTAKSAFWDSIFIKTVVIRQTSPLIPLVQLLEATPKSQRAAQLRTVKNANLRIWSARSAWRIITFTLIQIATLKTILPFLIILDQMQVIPLE